MSERNGEIGSRIRAFVRDELATQKGVPEVGEEESLVESGILDSLGVVRLVLYLEEEFGIRIEDNEVTAENFRTVRSIEQFVSDKGGMPRFREPVEPHKWRRTLQGCGWLLMSLVVENYERCACF
ncbi:MAG TPA: acyl carrier protein [Methylomirabilota bacterium]|nr:acyl carrier protein [Methylomirabilota bacterium]